mmetsp:Transcript_79446/g.199660  ORF Transcript_79446/g.199660 Transcript_79446/m.199660 type:complete len:170 (-) Transcript_79446:50-559(-)
MGTTACCGKRSDAFVFCRNERLNSYLEQMAKQCKEFDSAWLYREEPLIPKALAKPGDGPDLRPQYILLLQRVEAKEPLETQAVPLTAKVRRQLKLDWSRDGLTFAELDRRLPESMLVRSKVYEPPLPPREVLAELAQVYMMSFDQETWSSSHFCLRIIGKGTGPEYAYK